MPERELGANCQILYEKRRLAPRAVKNKVGIRRFTLDKVVACAPRTFGRDNGVLWQAHSKQAAVIDKLAGDRGVEAEKDGWYPQRADRPVWSWLIIANKFYSVAFQSWVHERE